MSDETPLISKGTVEAMLEKFKKKPQHDHICPRCLTTFSDKYEACYCRKYDVYDESDWEDVLE